MPHWRARAQDPIFWNDVTQLFKTVVAAVVAWLVVRDVLHLPQSFLAPWAALLVVHATVYRTFSRGARQVAGTVVGVVVAWAAGSLLGVTSTSVAVVLAVGLALGALPWFGEETTVAAATALVVLTSGFSTDDMMLLSRLGDTVVGVACGLLVNLVLWPPLRRRTAIAAMDRIDDAIGELLLDMADGVAGQRAGAEVDGWVDRTRDLDGDLDEAWALVRQAKESARLNARRSAADVRDPREWHQLLRRMEQAVAESRSMARTLVLDVAAGTRWDEDFRVTWVDLLRDAGRAVADARPQGLAEVDRRLDELVARLRSEVADTDTWPVYGGLITNLRNILDAMTEVAAANPLRQPPLPGEALLRRG